MDNPFARMEAEIAALRSRCASLEAAQMLQALALTQQATSLAALLSSLGELPGERTTAEEAEPARRGPGRPPKVTN